MVRGPRAEFAIESHGVPTPARGACPVAGTSAAIVRFTWLVVPGIVILMPFAMGFIRFPFAIPSTTE